MPQFFKLTCFLCLFIPILGRSQSSNTKSQSVGMFCTSPAQFPGGDDSLMAFIKRNFNYNLNKEHLKGRIGVRFVVMENGRVDSIEVYKSVSVLLDNEAKRVVGLFPAFKPALNSNGHAMHQRFALPINIE